MIVGDRHQGAVEPFGYLDRIVGRDIAAEALRLLAQRVVEDLPEDLEFGQDLVDVVPLLAAQARQVGSNSRRTMCCASSSPPEQR